MDFDKLLVYFYDSRQTMGKRDHAKKVEAMREWNDEELRMLDKAVAKFPQVYACTLG
jgi:hypothetical protein